MENKRVWHLRFDVTPPFLYYGSDHVWSMSVPHPSLKQVLYDSHIQKKSTILRNLLTNSNLVVFYTVFILEALKQVDIADGA